MIGVREGKEKTDELLAQQSHPQKRQKRQQQQQPHNPQTLQTSQTTLSEFETRELIKQARSILEGY